MKKLILIFVAILVSIKLITLIGFTESELIIAGIIFAFYLLIEKIEELQQRVKTLEYKRENEHALKLRADKDAVKAKEVGLAQKEN